MSKTSTVGILTAASPFSFGEGLGSQIIALNSHVAMQLGAGAKEISRNPRHVHGVVGR